MCALDTTGMAVEWLEGLMFELSMVNKPPSAISLHYDSKTTIAKLKSSKYNKKQRRHIQVRPKLVRELISIGVMTVDFVDPKITQLIHSALDLVQKSMLGLGLKIH